MAIFAIIVSYSLPMVMIDGDMLMDTPDPYQDSDDESLPPLPNAATSKSASYSQSYDDHGEPKTERLPLIPRGMPVDEVLKYLGLTKEDE